MFLRIKRFSLALAAFLATQFAASSPAQDGVLDLAVLKNYANQEIPAYIQKSNTPAGNQISDAGATLGRVLFYDKRLSRNNTVSCSSCHNQARAFTNGAIASPGVAGSTGRHAMPLANARFGTEHHFFWDERATTLENQTTQPIKNAIEMGFSGANGDPAFSDLISKLAAIPEYPVLFNFAFGSPTIDETRVQNALAQFVRSIQSFDSKYDAGRALAPDNQPFSNFTASENNGKQLFLGPPDQGGAGCAACHRPPEFDIDPNSGNNGVIAAIDGSGDLTNTRAPSLRNLARPGGHLNGPLMHDGSFTTLEEVIYHYATIPADNPNLDPRLRRFGGVQTLEPHSAGTPRPRGLSSHPFRQRRLHRPEMVASLSTPPAPLPSLMFRPPQPRLRRRSAPQYLHAPGSRDRRWRHDRRIHHYREHLQAGPHPRLGTLFE